MIKSGVSFQLAFSVSIVKRKLEAASPFRSQPKKLNDDKTLERNSSDSGIAAQPSGESVMSKLNGASWASLILVVSLAEAVLGADPANTAATRNDSASIERASELVGQALQAEIAGDLLARSRLLLEATHFSAQYPPAQWRRGHISHSDGSWLTVDEAIESARSDKQLAQYETMRAQLPASVQGNWQAANWCAQKNMPQQCRAHLENILMLDHDNATARKALGHQLFGNDWLTHEDQFEMAAKAAFASKGFAKYQQVISDLVRKIRSFKGNALESAWEELQLIDDPLAIPVMESLVGQYEQEISVFVVNWLGKIDHPQAALSLARIAMYLDEQAIRIVAVENLKQKSLFDFVPDLLAAMSSPIVFQSMPVYLPNGALAGFRQAYAKEGMQNYQILKAEIVLRDIPVQMDQFSTMNLSETTEVNKLIDYDPTQPYGQRRTWQRETTTGASYSEQRLREISEQNYLNAYYASVLKAIAEQSVLAEIRGRNAKAEVENHTIGERNKSIAAIITEVSQQEFARVPQDVWQWWDRYNETNYQRSKFQRYKYESQQAWVPRSYVRTNYVGPDQAYASRDVQIYKASCFVAGTKVNTLRGLVEIEQIMPGDMVLSLNVVSGELSFKPVICRTTRDPAKTVILKVDNDTIHATTSHLLWVSGKGWTKAGEIKPGDLLHAASEPAVVMSSTSGGVLPTHNLIVADNHTYFVESSQVLSHDVLPRGSVHEVVPGQFVHSE